MLSPGRSSKVRAGGDETARWLRHTGKSRRDLSWRCCLEARRTGRPQGSPGNDRLACVEEHEDSSFLFVPTA